MAMCYGLQMGTVDSAGHDSRSALSTRDYIAIATAVPAFPFIALDLSPDTMKLACLSCKFSAHTGVCRVSSEPSSSHKLLEGGESVTLSQSSSDKP